MLVGLWQLGEGFAEASVEGRPVGELLELDLEVVIPADPAAVVAHLIEPGGEDTVVALTRRRSGVFGAVERVRPVDLVVVFEVVGDPPQQSSPARLTELGLDPGLLGVGDGPREDPLSPSGDVSGWGWLALAAAAAALAALALWALPSRSDDPS